MAVTLLKGLVLSLIGFFGWVMVQYQSYAPYLEGLEVKSLYLNYPQPFQQYVQNQPFTNAEVITSPQLNNPQDIEIDEQGNIYTGLIDGRIVKITSNRSIITIAKSKKGRIYGLKISHDNKNLYFMSANGGLCVLNFQTGLIRSLLSHYENKFMQSMNSLDISSDDKMIYLTQSSVHIPMQYHEKQFYLKNPFGRVFSYNISSQKVQLLLQNLYFPNGLVYEQESNSILVAQLMKYRIIRINLHDNSVTVLSDNLPGVPDNMKLNQAGQLWVAFFTRRNKLSQLIDDSPLIRNILLYSPINLIRTFLDTSYTGGLKIDRSTGEIKEYWLGSHPKITFITTVLQKNGKRYTAGLNDPVILVV